MAIGDVLLSGLRDGDRERQREEEERQRRRRHRSHRHSTNDDYHSSQTHRRRREGSSAYEHQSRPDADAHRSRRREPEYAPPRRSAVEARRPNPRSDVSARAPAESSRRRGSHVVSMRRSRSKSSSSVSNGHDTPPTTPGSAANYKTPQNSGLYGRVVRPEAQARATAQDNIVENSSDEDYSRLRPGRRKLRTGSATSGAHGTDFLVGVPSDIGSLPSRSDTEPEPKPRHERRKTGVHLRIVTKPGLEDKMMTGALPPGTAPHRTIGPPKSQSLVTKTRPKQDSIISQLLRPSPHHSNLKRHNTARHRSDREAKIPLPSPMAESPREEYPNPSMPPAVLQRQTSELVVPIATATPIDQAPNSIPEPEPTLECLTCCDDIPISKAAQLECDHAMCQSCLKRVFELSVTDPAHMPPKCCTQKTIPLKFVAPLFDHKFKALWNRKFQEFSTKDRMYCPRKGCGAWIKPENQKLDRSVGRRYGICQECNTKVCKKCNMKWHDRKDCKNDEETKQLLDTAKKEGWQRCYSCKAVVQLSEGCNHMKCRCTAEFCMICGSKWKTCDCPWFNTPAENDPLAGLFFPPAALLRPRVRMRAGRNGAPARPVLDPGAPPGHGFAAENAARQAQVQADEEFARRIQLEDLDMPPNPFDHLVHANFDGRPRHRPARGDMNMGALGLFAQIAEMAINHVHEERQETRRRQMRVGNATVTAAWTRPRRGATTNARSRARAPEPPAAVPLDDSDTESPSSSSWNSGDSGNPRAGRARRRGSTFAPGRPSTAAMAGLSHDGRRGRERVGGWLDHIAGGNPDAHNY